MPRSPQFEQAIEHAGNVQAFTVSGGAPSGPAEIDFQNASHKRQMEAVTVVRDVYRGTAHMREQGQTYLPKHAAEDDDDYRRRLSRARLFNAVAKTVEGYTGMIFKTPPALQDDVPQEIRGDADGKGGHAENIDLRGRHLNVFAKDVKTASMADGHSFIHVDMPAVDPNAVRTRADERRAGLRPYWVHVLKEDVVNWRAEIRDGKPVLTLFVYRECVSEPDGEFGEGEVTQYRELRPGSFRIWRQRSTAEGGAEWFVWEEGRVSLDFIPVAVDYSKRTGFLESEPPFVNLAHLNIGLWVNESEHEMSLARARVPMPFFKGISGNLKWGPNYSISTDNPDASAEMLESSGTALEASRQHNQDIRADMAAEGLSMLVRDTRAAETAEAKRIDAGAEDSGIAVASQGSKDGIEEALRIHAAYLGLDDGGSVEMSQAFRAFTIDAQTLAVIHDAVQSGDVPEEVLFYNLQRGGLWPEGLSIDEAKARRDAGIMETIARLKAQRPTEPAPTDVAQDPAAQGGQDMPMDRAA